MADPLADSYFVDTPSMSVPIEVLGLARESPKPNHWFKVVDDREASGGLFVLQGWDGVDERGRRFEPDAWVESLELLDAYFERLPWRIEWSTPVCATPRVTAAVPDRLRQQKRRALPRRLRVVVPCFLLGFALSTLLAILAGHLILCLPPLAGPFIAPLAFAGYDPEQMWLWVASLALAIAAHPARPGPVTGAVTVIGCFGWILLGMALTYSGV